MFNGHINEINLFIKPFAKITVERYDYLSFFYDKLQYIILFKAILATILSN